MNDTTGIVCLCPGLAFKHRTVDSYGQASQWSVCVTGQAVNARVLSHEFVTSDGARTSCVIKYKEKTKVVWSVYREVSHMPSCGRTKKQI